MRRLIVLLAVVVFLFSTAMAAESKPYKSLTIPASPTVIPAVDIPDETKLPDSLSGFSFDSSFGFKMQNADESEYILAFCVFVNPDFVYFEGKKQAPAYMEFFKIEMEEKTGNVKSIFQISIAFVNSANEMEFYTDIKGLSGPVTGKLEKDTISKLYKLYENVKLEKVPRAK